MSKLSGLVMAAALGAAAPSAAALGPDASACEATNVPALLVKVDGFKQRSGGLRVQIYGGNPEDFLAKGRKLKRIDLGVTRAGPMEVCVALPGPGNYAVAVRHDVDGSGKSGWNDGGGFSRNPEISLFNLKPKYRDVVVAVGHQPRAVEVILNYRQGLSIGPVARTGQRSVTARVALLSNPRSTGNRAFLPRVRSFCAANEDIFHYEVESVDQIGEALRTIARVRPKLLIINGGDGTVQATLTELYHGGHFGDAPPPVAVLPNGKTNLIALDLGAVGAVGDPLAALRRIMLLVRDDIAPHIVPRELIALSDGNANSRPVLGMFLGGAGLADSMLYCRHKLYPTGLPNGLCHALTAIAVIITLMFGVRAAFLPPRPGQMSVSMIRKGQLHGRFALLIVTTLTTMLLGSRTAARSINDNDGALKLMLVDHKPLSLIRGIAAGFFGKLGQGRLSGVHVERDDEIRIEGERSAVILDGELFEARAGLPIVLKPTAPVPFLHLAMAA